MKKKPAKKKTGRQGDGAKGRKKPPAKKSFNGKPKAPAKKAPKKGTKKSRKGTKAWKNRIVGHDRVDPNTLLKNPFNHRLHPEKQRKALAAAIREIGFIRSVTVNKTTGHIVDGHERVYQAIEDNQPAIDVEYVDLTAAEEKKALASLDAITEMADVDPDALAKLLDDIGPLDSDLGKLFSSMAGFAGVEYDRRGEEATGREGDSADQETPAPEDRGAKLQKKWSVKRGQVWKLGNHRLMCGDSTNAEDVSTLMNGEKAGLMNTDPPYGINHDHQMNAAASRSCGSGGFRKYNKIENDELTGEALQAFLERSIRAALAHLSEKPAFYLWHPMLTQGTFFAAAAAAAAADILIHRQIIWKKPHFIFGRGDFHWQHELCFYGWIRSKRCPFYGERNQSTVWEFSIGHEKEHSTEKPVALFNAPIENHLKPGEVAYDPFGGSGPQFVAAEKLNRRCFGMEIEPKYCAVILERMAQIGLEPTLLK